MVKLSVIIIVKNEEANIRRCLDAVSWADEIIVLDSGSTDATPAICQSYSNVKFSVTDWPGFGIQKNRALKLATGDWVLSIDADEVITTALKEEISKVIHSESDYVGYKLPRLTMFFGKVPRLRGRHTDYRLRLIKNGCGAFTHDLVHEGLLAQGRVGVLRSRLQHYTCPDIASMMQKNRLYAELGAQKLFANGKTASKPKSIGHGIWAFIRNYLFDAYCFEGWNGFVISFDRAVSTFYRYARLYELKNSNDLIKEIKYNEF